MLSQYLTDLQAELTEKHKEYLAIPIAEESVSVHRDGRKRGSIAGKLELINELLSVMRQQSLDLESLAMRAFNLIGYIQQVETQIFESETTLLGYQNRLQIISLHYQNNINNDPDYKNAPARDAALKLALENDENSKELKLSIAELESNIKVQQIQLEHTRNTLRLHHDLINATSRLSATTH